MTNETIIDTPSTAQPPGTVDSRAPRFGATITTALLLIGIIALTSGVSAQAAQLTLDERIVNPGFLILLIVEALFAWSLISARTHPYALVFRSLIRKRLSAPAEWEDARAPRFAQGVGFAILGIGIVLHLFAVPYALLIAASAAFIAAFLNAFFGFCLGCELYVLLLRAGVIRHAASR